MLGIGFDFDHTLGVDNGLETEAFYRLAAELGNPIFAADAVVKTHIAELLARFRATSITLEQMVTEFAAPTSAGAGARYARRYREICFGLVAELVVPVDGARETLAGLARRGVRTAILTNGWTPLQQMKIERALAFTGPVLVSDELGVAKPDAAAYAKLVDTLGVDRADCWYVGDNPETDVAGARGAGLRGIWLNSGEVSYPADAMPADAVIHKLSDLLSILPGQSTPTEKVRS